MNNICTSYDEFLQDKDETVWIAELNDGTKVYCDDGRYGETDKAWNRLREYLKQGIRVQGFTYEDPIGTGPTCKPLMIQKIFVKFRSHVELAAERHLNTVGFYFGRAASCWVGSPTNNYIIIGQVENIKGNITVKRKKYRVPEVILEENDEVNINEYMENVILDD